MPQAIIIGAGVAGTSAAEYLSTAGWQVIVLDKAARPGGRCATQGVAADGQSPWFDYGAQYFTARDGAFRAQVAADLEAGELARWRPLICMAENTAGGWRLDASPDERERLIGPHGINSWIRRRLAACGAPVRCDTRVTAIAETGDGWCVDATAGRALSLTADAVVVTTPAVQAARLLGDAADPIPVLAAPGRAMRACHALVVEAPALAECHGAFIKNGALSWIADNSHKAGDHKATRHLWTLHAGPDFSDQRVDAATAEIAPMLVREFADITGIDAFEIDVVHAHRWRYARPGDNAPAPRASCHVEARRRLAFAGDWLAGGRVEGAWRSGRAAAAGLTATCR